MDTSPMDTLEGTMKTTLDFLEAVKTKHGFTSDYQLSKHLECTRGAISSYRTGRTHLDEEMACKIADDLGLEAGFVLSCIAAERSKNPKVKKAWAWTAHHLGGLAAALAVLAIIPFYPDIMSTPSFTPEGTTGMGFAGFTEAAGIYIMRISDPATWPLYASLAILLFAALPRRHRQ